MRVSDTSFSYKLLIPTVRNLVMAGLIAGLSSAIVGCGAINNIVSSSASSAGVYAVGNGEKITTETGTYEKLVVPENSVLYKVNEEAFAAANLGYTKEEIAAGQKLAIDYVLTQALDSSALEGGDPGYQSWVEKTAPTYFSDYSLRKIGSLDKANGLVFGNIGGSMSLPKLINDGEPRLKNATAKVTGYSHETLEANGPISATKYTIEFSADYRVSDNAAAEFAAFHSGTTPEQFLASENATEAVKDGTGENVHRAYGTMELAVAYAGDHNYELSALRIFSSRIKADFDYSSYSKG